MLLCSQCHAGKPRLREDGARGPGAAEPAPRLPRGGPAAGAAWSGDGSPDQAWVACSRCRPDPRLPSRCSGGREAGREGGSRGDLAENTGVERDGRTVSGRLLSSFQALLPPEPKAGLGP